MSSKRDLQKKANSQLILRQSNKISRSSTVPGLRQAKAYRYLLFKARNELLNKDYHIVYQEELKQFLGSNDWETLKNSIEELRKIDVRWDLLPQKGDDDELLWGSSSLLADCEIRREKKGRIYFKYSFSPKMREELANPKFFRDFDLSIIKKFQSSYSLKFYEFCHSAINPGQNHLITEFIPKDSFWALLGLSSDEYKNYYNFTHRVIKPALKEIKEITDLNIEIERVKRAPKVYDFRFVIQRKNRQQCLVLRDESLSVARKQFLEASKGTQEQLKAEFLERNPQLGKKAHGPQFENNFMTWMSEKYNLIS